MLAKESAAATFNLPEEVLAVLPSDPYEQLDVARKITSMALLTRISSLESESSGLCAKLVEKDHSIADLQFQVESLDASLTDALNKLSRSELEKEKLVKENESLTSQLTFKTLLHPLIPSMKISLQVLWLKLLRAGLILRSTHSKESILKKKKKKKIIVLKVSLHQKGSTT